MSWRLLDILRNISHFLFSKANREFLLFLFFLVLSSIFWLITTLNENYEKDVKLFVRYINIPKNAVITSNETDSLRVTISDKGFNLLALIYGQNRQPVEIDFQAYAKDGMGTVPKADLQHLVERELPASAKLVTLKTERLVFYYNYGESKKVPVRWSGNITPAASFFIAKTTLDPDSVTVFASRNKLDSIESVTTEELECLDVHDTLTVSTPLKKIIGVKTQPAHVKVCIFTDVLTEEIVADIPVIGINMPPGKVLRTFPAKVKVHIVTGMKNFRALSPQDFSVVADYSKFSQESSSKCAISLQRYPEGILKAYLDVSRVDYLIEEVPN